MVNSWFVANFFLRRTKLTITLSTRLYYVAAILSARVYYVVVVLSTRVYSQE